MNENRDYTDTEEYKNKSLFQKIKFRVVQFFALGGLIILIILSIIFFFTVIIPFLSVRF